MADRPEVRVGQVWADCDKRQDGRHVKVIAIEEARPAEPHKRAVPARAVVLPCNSVGGVFSTGGRTRIRIDRFRPTPTGFRLVMDVGQDVCSCAPPVHVRAAAPSCVHWPPQQATSVTTRRSTEADHV